MNHPNTGQVATPRLRPSRAPTNPASGGAGGPPPFWTDNHTDIIARAAQAAATSGLSTRFVIGSQRILSAADRHRIENCVEMMTAFLDALDAPLADLEPDFDDDGVADEGCCEAGDDDPARSRPAHGVRGHCFCEPGDPDDGEPSLGWTNSGHDTLSQNAGVDDLEDATADLEPDHRDAGFPA